MGRDAEYAYARERDLPVPPPRKPGEASFSNDDNIWGFTAEGGDIEYPDRLPPLHDCLRVCTPPDRTSNELEHVRIGFVDGRPTSLNGTEMAFSALIAELNRIGGRHGVGFSVLIEDRIVGLKVRGVYENPAAHLLILAHRNLERITKTRELLDMKAQFDLTFSNYVYQARWYSQPMGPVWAFIEEANRGVTGTVTIEVGRGGSRVLAVQSPLALFDANLATFDTSTGGGPSFNTGASAPFIELYSLADRQAYRVAERLGLTPTI